jgi:hypothetical protein
MVTDAIFDFYSSPRKRRHQGRQPRFLLLPTHRTGPEILGRGPARRAHPPSRQRRQLTAKKTSVRRLPYRLCLRQLFRTECEAC